MQRFKIAFSAGNKMMLTDFESLVSRGKSDYSARMQISETWKAVSDFFSACLDSH